MALGGANGSLLLFAIGLLTGTFAAFEKDEGKVRLLMHAFAHALVKYRICDLISKSNIWLFFVPSFTFKA